MASAITAAGLGPASAGSWEIEPSVTAKTTYTDNVRAVSDGAESDLLYEVRPGIRVRGSGARLQVNLDASVGYEDYLSTDDLGGWNFAALGNAQAELFEDILFLDASTSYQRRAIRRSGALSAVDRDLGRNQADVFTLRASPFVRLRFRNFAQSITRLSVASTMYNPAGQNDDPDAEATSDAIVWSISETITSGSRFSRLAWEASASHTVTDREGNRRGGRGDDDTFKRSNVGASAQYAVNRWLAATGRAGIDWISGESSRRDDIDGPYYLVGPRLTGPRSHLYFAAGHRYGHPSYEGSASYRISSALVLRGFYDETVTTQQELAVQPFDFVGVDEEGNLIDTRTGLPLDPGDPFFDLTEEDRTFRQRTLRFGLTGTRLRNTYLLEAFLSRRDSTGEGRDRTTTGGVATFSRQLSPHLRLSLNASLRSIEDDAAADQTTLQVGSSLSYALSETLTTTVSLQHFDRDSKSDSNDLSENTLTVSLRKTF